MRKLILFALVANMGFFGQSVHAQDPSNEKETEAQKEYRLEKEQEKKERIESLKQKRAMAIQSEKDQLKDRVAYINKQLEKGNITDEDAELQKKTAANYTAKNIENKTTIIDTQIALIERNGVMDGPSQVIIGLGSEDEDGKRIFGISVDNGEGRRSASGDRRTTSAFVFSLGFNNSFIDGESLGDTYRLGRSGYVEYGWSWKTRVLDNSNAIRFKYGFSFNFSTLSPKDDKFFVEAGNQTVLQEFEGNLRRSEFKNTQLIFPLFFEFGPSKKIDKETYFRYSTDRKFKVGLGGFAGVNIGTKQKLIFTRDGDRVKQNTRTDFNTNDFVYGLNAYIAVGSVGLYAKYDLNPIFKDNLVDENNFSLGLRFDLD